MRLSRIRCQSLVVVLCASISAVGAAQQNSSSLRAPKASRDPKTFLLEQDDGLAVISAALESRGRSSAKLDCSHLVHEIYQRAGFSYAYQNSSDLYGGTSEFQRVTHPQPGDLVVWPGHVGIIVSPVQHTFFSALTSGLGVDSYTSSYWKNRGRARFLRFVKNDSVPKSDNVSGSHALISTSLERTPSGRSADLREKDSDDREPSSDGESVARITVSRVQNIESSRPASENVAQAVRQAFNETGEALREQDVFNLPATLLVVTKLEVLKVKIKGDQGWAEVRMTESASLATGQSNLKKRQERQQLALRRIDARTWEVTLPQSGLYVLQESAVQLLAHQLAALTEAADASPKSVREKSQLAALLNTLLESRD